MLSAVGEIPAEVALCFATGNTAKIRKLTGGTVEVGRDATFVFLDKAQHSAGKTVLESIQAGDLPGIGAVMIDGMLACQRSRNTPPATRVPEIAA
jgi:enamidase